MKITQPCESISSDPGGLHVVCPLLPYTNCIPVGQQATLQRRLRADSGHRVISLIGSGEIL